MSWTYVISYLNSEEILGTFYGKKIQKINQYEFKVEKVIEIKSDKLYVIWDGYDNSFNSGIDKKKTNERIFFETETFGGNVRVELNIPNYVTKTGLKTQQMLINKNLRKG